MAWYWGTVYGVCLFFALVGIILILAGVIGGCTYNGRNCFSDYNDCYQATKERSACADAANAVCKYRTWVSLLVAGIIIFLVGGLAPTSYCCCCSNAPKNDQQGQIAVTSGQAVVVQSYPQQPVMAQTFVPAGQPVMAQPYVPGQPVMAQPYVPGQPVMAQPYTPK